MTSKKKTLATEVEKVTSVSEHPEYVNELAPEALLPATVSAQAPEREAQIRDIAYAAYERRGAVDGNAVQDWLNAEAQWESDQKR